MKQHDILNNELLSAFDEQIPEHLLQSFLAATEFPASDGKDHYLAVSMMISPVDTLAIIEQSKSEHSFQYYWEKPSDQFSIAAGGELERVTTKGSDRFRISSQKGKDILSRVHHVSGIRHSNAVVHLFGGFSFFDESPQNDWESYQSASFTLPEWMIIKEGKATILTFLLKWESRYEILRNQIERTLKQLSKFSDKKQFQMPEDTKKLDDYSKPDKSSAEYKEWIHAVENARDAIRTDQFEKVVLARKLQIKLNQEVSATRILNQLRNQYPDCYSFLIRQDQESAFIGSTPERLASFRSDFVLTEGLAGSTSRGRTATEDALLEHALLNSSKDLKEHEIVLEAINENLTSYSDSINLPDAPQIKKLSNVQHLYTPITAQIRKGVSRTEVLKTLHPTPAVGGFPRQKAVEFIRNIENFERGWYASPVGWINAHGNGEFVVAIRSGLIRKEEVQFFAGCGIVEDSDPDKEWDETNLKFIPMLSALEYAGN